MDRPAGRLEAHLQSPTRLCAPPTPPPEPRGLSWLAPTVPRPRTSTVPIQSPDTHAPEDQRCLELPARAGQSRVGAGGQPP